MALSFSEFIECSSISINYDKLGLASVSFTVISSSMEPAGTYTSLEFGGVTFDGYVTGLELRRIPGTRVYEHRYTISATGC